MATKAQLEAELTELKQQLAQQALDTDSGSEAEPSKTVQSGAERPGGGAAELDTDTDTPDPDPVPDWETQLQEILKELENLPLKKPLLLALGALALGYLIGRSR